jgi:predicted GIY-YIG superfamily endonuclease
VKRSPNVDWSFLPANATPGQPGAYVVRDSADSVLYVGHTDNLLRRMRQGHRYRSAWFPQMAQVAFLPCRDVTEARIIEKALIAHYRPAANINDFRAPEKPGKHLLEPRAARLVELNRRSQQAHPRHREAEAEALDQFIAHLRAEHWTLAAIGKPLGLTRQAVSIRLVRAAERAASARAAA